MLFDDYLLLQCNGVSQMNRQLSDVQKGVAVRKIMVKQINLDQGLFHEVYPWQCVG